MTDQPALPPADDRDDVELTIGWLVDGNDRYRVIREKGDGDAWLASTTWFEWDDDQTPST